MLLYFLSEFLGCRVIIIYTIYTRIIVFIFAVIIRKFRASVIRRSDLLTGNSELKPPFLSMGGNSSRSTRDILSTGYIF